MSAQRPAQRDEGRRGTARRPTAWLALAALALSACSREEPAARADPEVGADGARAQAGRDRTAQAPTSTRSVSSDDPGAASSEASRGEATPASEAPSPVEPAGEDGAARIYSKVRFSWIRPAPRPGGSWLGYLSLGDSVALRGGTKPSAQVDGTTSGAGDCAQWYAVEPEGYLCEGSEATTDPDDPLVSVLRQTSAKAGDPWPYRYGESTGTPVYADVPELAEQRRQEPDLDDHLRRAAEARATAEADRAEAWSRVLLGPFGQPPPPRVSLHPLGRALATRVAPGSTIAYTRAFDAGDRSWLLTWDWGVVPADRVRRYEPSQFQGVQLDERTKLPLAFFRKKERPQYRLRDDGTFEPTGESWPRHGWVALGEKVRTSESRRFLETLDRGLWCAEPDATVVRASDELPPRVANAREGRRTWVEISVLGGWLVAYEAERAVFATLISPGRGGIPYPGIPPIDTASTPVGQFTVTGKFVTATMVSSSDSSIVHAEVQYTQNFSGPHALHGAYWHDEWGEPKSGGCVNLSPIDARWLFDWSEPRVPEGWHGKRWVPGRGESTAVWIHR